MSYLVPIHRPSGARLALKLRLLEAESESIVVAKANRLEIYSFSPDTGLTLVHSRSVYGYVIMLEAVRPADARAEHLFIGTDRHQYFTCSWDPQTRSLKTEQSFVDQADKTLRDTREHDRVHTDPTRRYMTLEMHDGIITVVPIVQASSKKLRRDSSARQDRPGMLDDPISVRIEETIVRSSAFMDADEDSRDAPRLGLLWEDNQAEPQLKIMELSTSIVDGHPAADLKTVAELHDADQLDRGVTHLLPVPSPHTGFLVLGERSIAYADPTLQNFTSQRIDEDGCATAWSCWTRVDNSRWLLGDEYGNLYFLMLTFPNNSTVASWQLDKLDQGSKPSKASCLIYLDAGLVFVGSHSGDSQLVQIQERGVEIIQTFSNIAPILDLQLMDLGRGSESAVQTGEFSTGQARLVTCSGSWQDGSIRSVRSGVGMEEIGHIGEIPLITDMWAVSSTGASESKDVLFASFPTETRVFKFDAESSVEEVDQFCNIELAEPTLLVSNLPDGKLLQVQSSVLRVSDLESGMTVLQWKPASSTGKITAADSNDAHTVIVEDGCNIHIFHHSGQTDGPTSTRKFDQASQISSVAVPRIQSNVCVVSFWQTAEVALLDIHSLETIKSQSLGLPTIDVPRSILVAQVLPQAYPTLFISMADGTVMTFVLDISKNELTSMTRILLGSEPVFLKCLPRISEDGRILDNVFASCEQPSLIYASEGRMLYSAINSDQAARVCPFSSDAYPGAIAVATPSELKLAMIDTTRTTQIQTLPIGDTVRCLAYHPRLKMFGMVTVKRELNQDGSQPQEELRSFVKLVDEVTFKEIDSFAMDDNEVVECIASLEHPHSADDDPESSEEFCRFVVGTSKTFTSDKGAHEEKGRILVFSADRQKQRLELIAELRTRGSCRSLAVADGLIIAGLVKVVALYSLAPSSSKGAKYDYKLQRLATFRTSTNPESLDVISGSESSSMVVAVGDLMKSMSVVEILRPSLDEPSWIMQETARHFATVWTSAVAAVGNTEWALADAEGNLLMLRQNPEAYGDEARRLEVTGEMRIGEVVNKIIAIRTPYSRSQKTDTLEKGKARTGSTSRPVPCSSSLSDIDSGPLIRPQAFVATVEGSIYLLGAINAPYIDALLRLQACLSPKVEALGGMPWSRYRAFKTEVREADEPFRFVDGEVLEQGLLNESDQILQDALKDSGLGESGLTVARLRAWGEDLRRLY